MDVPIVELSGEMTTAAAAAGAVALASRTQPGDRAQIALGGSGAYHANVVPDVYDVVYGSGGALATVNDTPTSTFGCPRNVSARDSCAVVP